jgi:hypothetical protein
VTVRPRDLVIVCAVVLLGGVALVDALREDGETATPETRPTRAAEPEIDRSVSFPNVRASGSLVFLDRDADCAIREADVNTGTEYPLPTIRTNCLLSAPPVGERIAYGLGTSEGGATPFRFLDLSHPERELPAFDALFGEIVWADDGQFAAWCDSATSGFAYEVGTRAAAVPIEYCPRGFGPGQFVHTRGPEVLTHADRVVARAGGSIDQIAGAPDGTLVLLVDGRQLERHRRGRLLETIPLPAAYRGPPLVFSPDVCAAILHGEGRAEIRDLGCFRGPDAMLVTFEGVGAVWSPDGEWIALAEPDAIVFHRVVGPYTSVRWPARAAALAWLR